MIEETIKYKDGSFECNGFAVYDESIKAVKPAVLVVHDWKGQNEFARDKARQLAKLGYFAFAVDMFGGGKTAANDDEAGALITPFYTDRKLLRHRIIAAFNKVAENPLVDKSRIGAIGFCFGGMTVVELLLSGAPVKSVTCFHGLFKQAGAKIEPIAKNIKGSLLILHGYEDPLSSHEDLLRAQSDFNEAGIEWQMNIYGHASHAFTNPVANDRHKGLIYNAKVSERAWKEMINNFKETL